MLTPPRDGGHLCKMHFGCKAHIDMDKESGPAYTVKVTAADIHDVAAPCGLLIGGEEAACGDSGYLRADMRPEWLKRTMPARESIAISIAGQVQ